MNEIWGTASGLTRANIEKACIEFTGEKRWRGMSEQERTARMKSVLEAEASLLVRMCHTC